MKFEGPSTRISAKPFRKALGEQTGTDSSTDDVTRPTLESASAGDRYTQGPANPQTAALRWSQSDGSVNRIGRTRAPAGPVELDLSPRVLARLRVPIGLKGSEASAALDELRERALELNSSRADRDQLAREARTYWQFLVHSYELDPSETGVEPLPEFPKEQIVNYLTPGYYHVRTVAESKRFFDRVQELHAAIDELRGKSLAERLNFEKLLGGPGAKSPLTGEKIESFDRRYGEEVGQYLRGADHLCRALLVATDSQKPDLQRQLRGVIAKVNQLPTVPESLELLNKRFGSFANDDMLLQTILTQMGSLLRRDPERLRNALEQLSNGNISKEPLPDLQPPPGIELKGPERIPLSALTPQGGVRLATDIRRWTRHLDIVVGSFLEPDALGKLTKVKLYRSDELNGWEEVQSSIPKELKVVRPSNSAQYRRYDHGLDLLKAPPGTYLIVADFAVDQGPSGSVRTKPFKLGVPDLAPAPTTRPTSEGALSSPNVHPNFWNFQAADPNSLVNVDLGPQEGGAPPDGGYPQGVRVSFLPATINFIPAHDGKDTWIGQALFVGTGRTPEDGDVHGLRMTRNADGTFRLIRAGRLGRGLQTDSYSPFWDHVKLNDTQLYQISRPIEPSR